MFYEEAAKILRNGGKINTKGMNDDYLQIREIQNNQGCNKYLTYVTESGSVHLVFSIPNVYLMSEDWVEYPGIKPSPMYADRYFVKCPKCGKSWHVGVKWENRVGDINDCECGCRVLLEPPVDYDPRKQETATPEIKTGKIKTSTPKTDNGIWRTVA